MRPPAISLHIGLFLIFIVVVMVAVDARDSNNVEQLPLPLDPDGFVSTTVPALPVPRADNKSACRLDLSDELFGGVGDACIRGGLDRSRCCPVLAAWLFAAHARSALELQPPPPAEEDDGFDSMDGPMMPDDNQKCVESLQSALERRDIRLPQPNSTCDTVLCFCGIRLHQIGSLRCPAAFNLTNATSGAGPQNATPTAAVRQLEHNCRNASYAGCTRCLHSLEKVKGHGVGGNGGGDRAAKMFARDCQLMGLTWLLARNKTAYIPTVSAVLRAVLYSAHPPQAGIGGSGERCSPDQENMPLAVDSLQFQRFSDSAAVSSRRPAASVALLVLILMAWM
ncbi:hypothetical protein Cni_G13623 [Canna indica]|uniref:SPARK domain-containing protein n=1 Tax=Canna indica TaxID=4628 RepID=A0AAQ3KAG2_9LILI|nr:hypothetical protein Cni_G13623 [Canna indica]